MLIRFRASRQRLGRVVRDIAEAGHLGYKMLEGVNDTAEMSEEQMIAARDLSDKMAMMAAYRLAHVLNTIFSY